MNVFLLGGTGSIGEPVLRTLHGAGHHVVSLARSDQSADRCRSNGAEVIRGDMQRPGEWSAALAQCDAVIHLATEFSEDESALHDLVLSALVDAARNRTSPLRFLHTGGCWLYGETGDRIATEQSPLDPPDSFRWWFDSVELLADADNLATITIHPAMVYDRDGGVLDRFIESARRGEPIEIWGSANTRWPVVERSDLATAYRLILEAGEPGSAYNVSSEDGVRVGAIADAIASRFGSTAPHRIRPIADAVAEFGSWAEGPGIDQQMSADRVTVELGWRAVYTDVCAVAGSD